MTHAIDVGSMEGPFISDTAAFRQYPDVMWLIRLRWLAIAGVIIATAVADYQHVVATAMPLFTIAAAMAIFNLALWWRYRDPTRREANDAGAAWIVPQLFVDMVSLTLLLHYAGGAENPFGVFYAFHVAIGAVFLPRRTVWLVGLLAALLNTGLVLGEFFAILPHHALSFTEPPHLPPHPHRTPHDMHLMPEFIVSYLVAFNLMLLGIIYLVHTVAEHQRAAEARRQNSEQIAMSRERLARIGEITSGMAHTVRNPLHGVINAAEILRGKLSSHDPAVHELFDMMLDGLTRIDKVTTRLLVLTRDATLTMVKTDIGSLVQEAMRFVEAQARDKQVQLLAEQDSAPAIVVDPDHLFEALINLLDNAVAACRAGDTVKVTSAWTRTPRNGVCIRVQDTGSGMPPAVLDKVLDPFFTTKPVGEGSGLGLAITNRIVAAHDGELTLESAVGKGTSVQMFIPAKPGPEPEPKAVP